MNRIQWIILVLALIIPGAAGLSWGYLNKRAAENRTAEAVQAVADVPSADEYLAMYDRWSQLSPAQKAENPWGQGQYGGPDIQKRLRQDQGLRFKADLPDLDAGLKSYPTQLAEVLYGSGWPESLVEYQRQREIRSLIMTASALLLFSGMLFGIGGLIKYSIGCVLHKKTKKEQAEERPSPREKKKHARITDKRGSDPKDDDQDLEQTEPTTEYSDSEPKPGHSPGYFESVMGQPKRPDSNRTSRIAAVSGMAVGKGTSVLEPTPTSDEKSYFGWAMDSEQEDVAVTTLMTTHPVTNGLSELTEEVSAIRQFAAAQQDQMRKLQDGYDWMIVRRFCMRVIRCIDNLDDRIARLGSQDDVLQGCLEDIRDELIFALESSGVEQYQPDLKTPFKGLEKYVEAARQRVSTSNETLAGTIAEIIRPGYQYLISDDDIKIVRCAQVKLYDAAETEV